MLKSILAASDLSSRATQAMRRAALLAQDAAARLCCLHVVEDDLLEERMRDAVEAARAALSSQARSAGVPADSQLAVVTGHAFHAIGEEALAREADVIVLGAHRRRFLRDVFVGTTVERVTRSAGRPVLMVNAPPAGRWRKIVIATDMSETSARAARLAKAFGFLEGAQVSFVHCHAPVTRQMMIYAGVPVERVHEEAEREFQAKRRELAAFLGSVDLGDINGEAHIVEGVGADALAGFVERSSADLLVIGTRGLSGAKRLFLGSVAQELMGCLEIDVFAAPPQ